MSKEIAHPKRCEDTHLRVILARFQRALMGRGGPQASKRPLVSLLARLRLQPKPQKRTAGC